MKHRCVFAVIMSLVLTFFMSAWVTFINLGVVDHFVHYWFSAWLLAWPAAAIISFLFSPLLYTLAFKISDNI